METTELDTMETNNPKHSNDTQETQKKPSLHGCIEILAYIELFAGILLSFLLGFTEYGYRSGYDFNGGIFFACLIGVFASFVFTLGFAKIVEAANKYLHNDSQK